MALSPPAGGSPPPFISGFFRAELARILPLWEADGHVSHDEAQRLVNDYRLNDLYLKGTPSQVVKPAIDPATLALRVAFLIGSLLVGCGIIAFVAANWSAISDFGKAAILNATVLLLYLSGYYFWFKRNLPALGHSLIFAGSLAFGADLGLMAQGVNVSLPHFAGYGYWAAGVLCVAVLVRSIPILALAFIAGTIWLIGGWADVAAIPNLERFLGTAVALALAARWMHLRWLNWVSAGVAATGCLTFIGQTTEHWQWVAIGGLALCAITGFTGKLLQARSDDRGQGGLIIGLSWILALTTVLLVAIARVADAVDIYSGETLLRNLTATQAQGVALVAALALVAAFLGGTVAKPGVRSWPAVVLVCLSGLLAVVAALGHAVGINGPASASLSLAAGFVLSSLVFASFSKEKQGHLTLGLLALIAFALTLMAFAAEAGGFAFATISLMSIASFVAAFGGFVSRGVEDATPMNAGKGTAWLTVGMTAVVAAFHDSWSNSVISSKPDLFLQSMICVGLLFAAAVIFGLRQSPNKTPWPEMGMLACGAALAIAGLLSMAGAAYAIPTGLSIAASLGVGACLVGAGLSQERRPLYWLGSVYLVAIVLMRFFEYETTPLEKSIAFIIGGTLVLVLGAFFERRHRNQGVGHAH